MRTAVAALGVLAVFVAACAPGSAITISLLDYASSAHEVNANVGDVVQIRCRISGALAGEFSGFEAWINVDGPAVATGQATVGDWLRRPSILFFGAYETSELNDNGTPEDPDDDYFEAVNTAPADKQGGILFSPASLPGSGTIAVFNVLVQGEGDITVSLIPADAILHGTFVANAAGGVLDNLEFGPDFVIHSYLPVRNVSKGTRHLTIQEAVSAADPGNVLEAAAGIYPETVVIDKALTLQGAGSGTTTIDASAVTTTGSVVTINVPSGDLLLDGFTLKTSKTLYGISARGASPASTITISNNVILGTGGAVESDYDFGIIAGYGSQATLVIEGNTIDDTYNNSMLIERQLGETVITNNRVLGCWPSIYFLTHSGSDVASTQTVAGNMIDMSAADPYGCVGIMFVGGYYRPDLPPDFPRTGGYDDVVVAGNTLTGVGLESRGICLANYNDVNGSDGEIASPSVTGNTITGSSNGRGIQLIGYVTDADINSNSISGVGEGFRGWSGPYTSFEPAGAMLNNNSITGCGTLAVNWMCAEVLNAENNWWGSPDGPADPVGTIEMPDATASVSQMINAVAELSGSLGNGVTEDVDYYPWLMGAPPLGSTLLVLDVQDDSLFVGRGEKVTIDVKVLNLEQAIFGGQTFVAHDESMLGSPVVQEGEDDWEVLETFKATGGEIDFAFGNYIVESDDDAVVSRLVFTAGSSDGIARVTFRPDAGDGVYDTILAGSGTGAIYPTKIDGQWIIIDGTDPINVQIAADPSTWINQLTGGPVTLTFSAQDATSGIDHYELTVEGFNSGAPFTTVSPYLLDVTGLDDGEPLATVTAFDRAGNSASASLNLKLDKTKPVFTVAAAADPGDWTNADAVSISWAADYSCSGKLKEEILVDSVLVVTDPANPYSLDVTGYSDCDVHTVTVRATDNAGNVETSETSFKLDNTKPVFTVAAAADPADWTNADNVSISWTADYSCSGKLKEEILVDSVLVVTDPANPYSLDVTGYSDCDVHTVTVRATDNAGNVEESSTSFKLDNTKPVFTVAAAADPGDWTNADSVSISWTADSSCSGKLKEEILVDSVLVVTDPANPYVLDVTGYSDCDVHTVTVRATDNAGNIEVSETSFKLDNTGPVFTVAADPAGWTNADSISISRTIDYSCSGKLQEELFLDSVLMATNPADPYSLDVSASAVSDGEHTVTVKAYDNAGNMTQNSVTVYVDHTDPDIEIVSVTQNGNDLLVPGAIALQGDVVIVVDASDATAGLAGVPVLTLTFSDSSIAVVAGSGSGTYTYTYAVTASTPNDAVAISVVATDLAGNTAEDTAAFTVNKNEFAVTVQLQGLQPSSGGLVRTVTFVATGGTKKIWAVDMAFASGSDTSSTTLTNVPAGTMHLSAKTDWSLRRRVAATLDGSGLGSAAFTGANVVLGGDLDDSNTVMILDWAVLRTHWYTYDAVADITGDGMVNIDDYAILRTSWFKTGDSE